MLAGFGCGGNDGYRDRVYETGANHVDEADAGKKEHDEPDAGPMAPGEVGCTPPVTSDHMPARTSVIKHGASHSPSGVFTRDLFSIFRSNCGACHVEQGQGGLQISFETFSTNVTAAVVARIRSSDPATFMPPPASGGKAFDQRGADDPIVDLANKLDEWLAAGSPRDVFYPTGGSGAGPAYRIEEKTALAITNLGTCIPSAAGFASETEKSQALDEMFEKASELPERLEQTDLVSFDSEVLARYGVVAFAPAYTLWADNAKKLRMVRVPRGKSIAFDADTQRFDIPQNTRFYKTFYKEVVDYRGEKRFKKVETRLIVSRSDAGKPAGPETASLFGTYVWNEEETEALLLRDPLRNGKPFRDRTLTYVINEQVADEVIAQGPEDIQEALEARGVTRTYAVPGAARCVHCHMGAPNRSFVLGFTPLQLNRRPLGAGGVIEEAKRDELNQIQRLLDYGILNGLSSAKEITLLEESQGKRKPRNEHELNAQGYMVGNCSHCHNPVGFPSVAAPEIATLLNFYPSAEGGIFEFPLDRFSPRVTRDEGTMKVPYVSPSLFDNPYNDSEGTAWGEAYPKVIRYPFCQVLPGQSDDKCRATLKAPWRSLIYRNVDTPFTYAENGAIFPHMPLDTPGYDCRVRRLIGTWMVSLPVRFKYKDLTDGLLYFNLPSDGITPRSWSTYLRDPQPYEEVKPDQPGYRVAAFDAISRLASYQTSPRYTDCPEEEDDIVDPAVVRGEATTPKPITARPVSGSDEETPAVYSLNVPERPHFADTDLTEAAGDWGPRRPDWHDVLTQKPGSNSNASPLVIDILNTVHIDDVDARTQMTRSELALTEMPFGFWANKPGCGYSKIRKLRDYKPSERLRWMQATGLDADAAVYRITPGAQVFTSICQNCHGPLADSQGRNAAVMAELTGGNTRVANLRDGLFGPPGHSGANLARVFSGFANGSQEDWAGRYMVWMGLGGTQRTIPPTILALVGNTPILGQKRPGNLYDLKNAKDANMLTVAQTLCSYLLPPTQLPFEPTTGQVGGTTPLMTTNGDREMWERLCTFNNPLPIKVIGADVQPDATELPHMKIHGLLHRANYPINALVGDPARGVVASLSDDNLSPWCIAKETVTSVTRLHELWPEAPLCPDEALASEGYVEWFDVGNSSWVKEWTLRGATNAGLSAFLYLRALTKGEIAPPIPFDQCPN